MTTRNYGPGSIATVTALLLIAGSAMGTAGLGTGCDPSSDPACPAAERETILELVRQHRRAASAESQESIVDAIFHESADADVDPLLVASIVAKESSFRTRVVSHKGAVGLMQLRPFVARDVSLRSGVSWIGVETLHSPELNVRLGVRYYKELVDRFDGDASTALTAYNFGPTRVARQLRDGTYRPSRYARDILELYGQLRSRPAGGADRT
jgi:soluble lytic murein transglycosylase